MKSVLAIVLVCAVVAASAVELPSFIKICKQSQPDYNECLRSAIESAIISLANGYKNFRILPVEPLAVDSIKIGESTGPVSLRQEYKNIKIHGLTKDLKIVSHKFDKEKLILTTEAYNPQVDFVADYKVDGRILVLPIRGHGKSNITMYELKTRNSIYFEKYEKDGETYLKAKKYVIKFTPDHVALQFENLFDGDAVLAEPVKKILNENGDMIFKEVQKPYEESFGLVFTRLCNEIFSRIPFNQLFPL